MQPTEVKVGGEDLEGEGQVQQLQQEGQDVLGRYVSEALQLRRRVAELEEELRNGREPNASRNIPGAPDFGLINIPLQEITVPQAFGLAAQHVLRILQQFRPGREENYRPPLHTGDFRIKKRERPWIEIEVLYLTLDEIHKAGSSLAALCGHSTERVSNPIVQPATEDASMVHARFKISIDIHWAKVFQMAGYRNCKSEKEADAYISYVEDLMKRMVIVKDVGASSPVLGYPPKIAYADIKCPFDYLCYAERKTRDNDPMCWAYLPKVGLVPTIGARESKAFLLKHPFNSGAPRPPTPVPENPAVCQIVHLCSPRQYVLACFRSTGRGSAAALVIILTCLGLGIGVSAQVKQEKDTGAQASFQNLGELSISAQSGHIYGTVDVNGAVKAYNGLVQDIDTVQVELLRQTSESRFRLFINRTVCSAHRTLRAIRDDLSFACKLSKCYEEIKRTERCEEPKLTVEQNPNWWRGDSPFTGKHTIVERQALAGIAAVGAIGLSLFNIANTVALKNELMEQRGKINQISANLYQAELNTFENSKQIQDIRMQFDLIKNYTSEADAKQKGLFLIETFHSYIANTREFCGGLVGMMMRQEIHPRFFDYEHISKALGLITKKAAEVGLIPIYKDVAGIITEKMSYVADEGRVVFMIHVSMRHENLFQVYKYIPTPFTLSGNRSVVPKVEKSVLAVKDEMNEFLILSETEIKECPKMHGIYLCKHMVTRKNIHHSCLGALFKAQTQFAAHHCEFKKHNDYSEFVTQISEEKILVIIPNGHSVTGFVSCEGDDSQQQMIILKGRTVVNVKLGCVFTTPAHIFRSVQHHEIIEGFTTRPLGDMSLDIGNLKIWNDEPYANVLTPTFSPHLMAKPVSQIEGNGELGTSLMIGSIILTAILLTLVSVIYLPKLLFALGRCQQLDLLRNSRGLRKREGTTNRRFSEDGSREVVVKQHERRGGAARRERERSGSPTIRGTPPRTSSAHNLMGRRSMSPEPRAGGDGTVIAISSLSLPNRIEERERE